MDLADFPSQWQFPFHFGRKTCVAGKFPVGMPARGHSQQQANRERLTGNEGFRVGQKLSPNQLFSLVGLREAMWRNSNEQPEEQRKESNP